MDVCNKLSSLLELKCKQEYDFESESGDDLKELLKREELYLLKITKEYKKELEYQRTLGSSNEQSKLKAERLKNKLGNLKEESKNKKAMMLQKVDSLKNEHQLKIKEIEKEVEVLTKSKQNLIEKIETSIKNESNTTKKEEIIKNFNDLKEREKLANEEFERMQKDFSQRLINENLLEKMSQEQLISKLEKENRNIKVELKCNLEYANVGQTIKVK